MLRPVIDIFIAYQCECRLVIPLNLGGWSCLIGLILDNTYPFKVITDKYSKSEISKQLRDPEAFLYADR